MNGIELDQKDCGCVCQRRIPKIIAPGSSKVIVLDEDHPHGRISGGKKCNSDAEAVRIGILSKV